MIYGFLSAEALALLFIFFGLTIAVIIKQIRKSYNSLPYAPTLFLISIGLGYFSPYTGIIGKSIQEIASTDPRGILLIFLPPLIFESSLNSDWYIFRKQSVQIFILAFPAVFLSAMIIMTSIKLVIGYGEDYYTWSEAFMFGSVLSCTDTVAVLALLKEAGAPRKFNSLIEGESLFNDGSCMILFTISLELVGGSSPHILSIGQLFLQLTVGAIILGIIFGFFSAYMISKVSNNAILTLNVTVVSCYIIYFVAEYVDLGIRISGIMSLVSMGLYMAAFGKTKIATDAKQIVHSFWKIYIFVAETIIFILGGVLVGVQALRPEFAQMMNTGNIQKLFWLYLCMILARFLSITAFMPKLQIEGYGLKWKQVTALTYGGLRGAVGIAFTLILASNVALRSEFRMISLFNTSGCAFLTLMINAPTTSLVIRKLGLCVKSETKIRFFRKFVKECEINLTQQLEDLQKKKYLENSNWEKVWEQSGITEINKLINGQVPRRADPSNDTELNPIKSTLISDHVFEEIDPAIMQEIRYRFCLTLKCILWEKFEKNQCSNESIRALNECVNLDIDMIEEPLNSEQYLISHLHNPYFFPICYWLKSKPIIGSYAYSWIYDRVGLLYDVISTYVESLSQAQQACKLLPYDEFVQKKVIEQAEQCRKRAQNFLDIEIKKSYLQIMKRIQGTKAAHSILSFEKQLLDKSYQYGQIDDFFYKQMKNVINDNIARLENDSKLKDSMSDIDLLRSCQFFAELSDRELNTLLGKKKQIVIQIDQPVVKAYEKHKYLYFITRGEINQEYKLKDTILYRHTVSLYEIGGMGCILNQNRELEYFATAVSNVSAFCFPITDIKELLNTKPRIQAILYSEMFLLNIRQDQRISKSLEMTEAEWKKKKPFVLFKRLAPKEEEDIQNGHLVLLDGKLCLHDQELRSGYFQIKSFAKVLGPAKFYHSQTPLFIRHLEDNVNPHTSVNLRYSSSTKDLMRFSCIGSHLHNDTSIMRRTIFTKD